jgi:hypothetical protein
MAVTAGAGAADGDAGCAAEASGRGEGRAEASVVARLFADSAGSAARSLTSSVAGGAKAAPGSGGAKATSAPVSFAGAGCLSSGESVLTATITATAPMSPTRATIPFEANAPSVQRLVHRSGNARSGSSAGSVYTSHTQGINAAASRPDDGDSRPHACPIAPGAAVPQVPSSLAGKLEFVLSTLAAI